MIKRIIDYGFEVVVVFASLGSAITLAAPADTTGKVVLHGTSAWHTARLLLHNDYGVSAAFFVIVVGIIVTSLFKLKTAKLYALMFSTFWWTILSVSFLISSLSATIPWVAGGIALSSAFALVKYNLRE